MSSFVANYFLLDGLHGMEKIRGAVSYITPSDSSFISQISADNFYHNQYMDKCIYFDIYEILMYYVAYFTLLFLFRKYNKASDLVTNIISSFVCWRCILTRSTDWIISYYWYDLFIELYKKDYVMICHHLFTLYNLNWCSWYFDYYKIYRSLFLLKTGDLFMHHHKILENLELRKNKYVYYWQLAANSITLVLWLVFRVILPFGIYPFNYILLNVLGSIFHTINVIWVVKMYYLIRRTHNKLVLLYAHN